MGETCIYSMEASEFDDIVNTKFGKLYKEHIDSGELNIHVHVVKSSTNGQEMS